MLYKTCFHHILPGCPGLQAPMALPCLNDVLGGCNRAPLTSYRHLLATSEHGIGHPLQFQTEHGKITCSVS